MNQGDLILPTVYNIVVDSVVREMLMELCGPQEVHNGLRWEA